MNVNWRVNVAFAAEAEPIGNLADCDQRNCPDCGHYERLDERIERCSICGLGRTIATTKPVNEQNYLHAPESEEQKRIGYFEKLYARYVKGLERGRSLDVGCGSGLFVRVMRKHGWDAWGLDAYKEMKADNQTLFRGTLQDFRPRDRFQLITLVHSLEHMRDPNSSLKLVANLTAPHGVILIIVPNYSGIWSMQTGTEWPMLNMDEHWYHYTAEALECIVRKAGLTVLRTNAYSGYYAPSRVQVKQSKTGFYERGWGSIQPLRAIIFRFNTIVRPYLNLWEDWNGRGAEIQLLAQYTKNAI